MLFQSINFLLLCALTFWAYWRLPGQRLWILAIANALFYMAAGWQNLGLFLTASLLTYALGRVAAGPGGQWAVRLGVGLNLLNLCYFKYAGFLTANVGPLVGLPASAAGWFMGVVLPIGISFYTFQHISYLVDRRYKALPDAGSYLNFWVYIAFFGHSIAGPIMRGHEFLPQIAQSPAKRLDLGQLRYGLGLFAVGLFKKIVIADAIATQADLILSRAASLTFSEAWAAALLFAFQIYYDFSAYSDMAVGIGLMFGYVLRQNFRTPYVSADPGEFWQRWHVTLSEWIRDYVYIPLGGSRHGAVRAQINLMLAMGVSGLWHGAAWTFVAWGGYHGLLLVGHRGWRALRTRLAMPFFESGAYRVLATGVFFLLVTWGWMLFRAPTITEAGFMMRTMAWPDLTAPHSADWALLGALGLYGLHWLEYLARRDEVAAGAWWRTRVPLLLQGVVYAAFALYFMVSYDGGKVFIYFKF